MKIIVTDNFNRDYQPESLVADNIKNEDYAKTMCNALNEKFSGTHSPNFYKIVDDDYELCKGFEP